MTSQITWLKLEHAWLCHIFLSDKGQFSLQECEQNKTIASLRIHVERYMESLKNWHFLDRVIPISCANIASDAWIVVVCLSNFWPPIIS